MDLPPPGAVTFSEAIDVVLRRKRAPNAEICHPAPSAPKGAMRVSQAEFCHPEQSRGMTSFRGLVDPGATFEQAAVDAFQEFATVAAEAADSPGSGR